MRDHLCKEHLLRLWITRLAASSRCSCCRHDRPRSTETTSKRSEILPTSTLSRGLLVFLTALYAHGRLLVARDERRKPVHGLRKPLYAHSPATPPCGDQSRSAVAGLHCLAGSEQGGVFSIAASELLRDARHRLEQFDARPGAVAPTAVASPAPLHHHRRSRLSCCRLRSSIALQIQQQLAPRNVNPIPHRTSARPRVRVSLLLFPVLHSVYFIGTGWQLLHSSAVQILPVVPPDHLLPGHLFHDVS